MAKSTRALSGAAKDAFIDNVVGAEIAPGDAAGERVASRLKSTIAHLRVRRDAEDASLAPAAITKPQEAPARDGAFDPFTPNVIVTLRRDGRDAALAALAAIDDPEHLRLLAREQQLSIDTSLTSAAALRDAIVTAAARRVANRRAAAS